MSTEQNFQKQQVVDGKRIVGIKKIGKQKVYDITVADSHHYIMENGVVTHNTGIYYSADNIYIIGRQQDKDGDELLGYNFIINVEKSRYVKEKSKIPICVSFDRGISKWSGMLDLALEFGIVTKPKIGWYTRPHKEGDKNWRIKETNNKEFWLPILKETDFASQVAAHFKLAQNEMINTDAYAEDEDEA